MVAISKNRRTPVSVCEMWSSLPVRVKQQSLIWDFVLRSVRSACTQRSSCELTIRETAEISLINLFLLSWSVEWSSKEGFWAWLWDVTRSPWTGSGLGSPADSLLVSVSARFKAPDSVKLRTTESSECLWISWWWRALHVPGCLNPLAPPVRLASDGVHCCTQHHMLGCLTVGGNRLRCWRLLMQ